MARLKVDLGPWVSEPLTREKREEALMKRSWVLAIVLIVLVAHSVFGVSNVLTDQCVNGSCVILARTSPIGLLGSVALLALTILVRPAPATPAVGQTVRLRRRVGAFFIDVFVAMMIVVPLAAMPMLLYAASVSKVFEWAVQVSQPDWWDHVIAVVLVISSVAGLALYYQLPLRRGRQTLGQYVLGYRLEPSDSGKPQYAKLTMLSFVGACLWPISLAMAASRSDREFWWNRASGMHAVRLEGGAAS